MTRASDLDLTNFFTQERHKIHLIGVAGSGMSGIAGLLLQLGHDVSGSDKVTTLEIDRLQRLGLTPYFPETVQGFGIGHDLNPFPAFLSHGLSLAITSS